MSADEAQPTPNEEALRVAKFTPKHKRTPEQEAALQAEYARRGSGPRVQPKPKHLRTAEEEAQMHAAKVERMKTATAASALARARTQEEISRIKQAMVASVTSGTAVGASQRKLGISSHDMVKWQVEDLEFRMAMDSARESFAEHLSESLLHMHETIEDPRMARVASDNARWYLERRHRKMFGASVDVNVNTQISVSSALAEARSRLVRPIRDPEIVDVTPDPVSIGVSAVQPSDYESDGPDLTAFTRRDELVYVPDEGQEPKI